MRIASLLAIVAALSVGCTGYPPRVDFKLGQAVLLAQARQVIDPDAPSRDYGPVRIDGQAAKASVDRYETLFEVPPPPVNVFNIGIGSGAASQ
jgi:hypothetical protein